MGLQGFPQGDIGGVENPVCIKTMCHTNFLCDRSNNLLNDKEIILNIHCRFMDENFDFLNE
jgi:hypothetical protein